MRVPSAPRRRGRPRARRRGRERCRARSRSRRARAGASPDSGRAEAARGRTGPTRRQTTAVTPASAPRRSCGSEERATPTSTASNATVYRSVRSDSIRDPVGRLDHSADAAVQAVRAPNMASASQSRRRIVIRSRATSAAAEISSNASSVSRQLLGKNPPPARPTTRTTPKATIAGRASIHPIGRLLRTDTASPSNRGVRAAASGVSTRSGGARPRAPPRRRPVRARRELRVPPEARRSRRARSPPRARAPRGTARPR